MCKPNGECLQLTKKNLTYVLGANDSVFFTPSKDYQGHFGARFAGAYGSWENVWPSNLPWKIAHSAYKLYGVVSS